jgi:hypothetical protein
MVIRHSSEPASDPVQNRVDARECAGNVSVPREDPHPGKKLLGEQIGGLKLDQPDFRSRYGPAFPGPQLDRINRLPILSQLPGQSANMRWGTNAQ